MAIKNYQLFPLNETWSSCTKSSCFSSHRIHIHYTCKHMFKQLSLKLANFIFQHGILATNGHAFTNFMPVLLFWELKPKIYGQAHTFKNNWSI